MSRSRTACTSCSNCGAIIAPAWWNTTIPSFSAISVGMERILKWAASSCSSSVLILANTMSPCFSAAASKIGPNDLHGPHHGAQKSRITMPSPSTVSLKVSAVTFT
ncbi:hypothetical protein D3C78_1492620 [compost metagenome]